jgi:hypothetical protein
MSRLSKVAIRLRLNCGAVSRSATRFGVMSLARVTRSQCTGAQGWCLLTIAVTPTPGDGIALVALAGVFENRASLEACHLIPSAPPRFARSGGPTAKSSVAVAALLHRCHRFVRAVTSTAASTSANAIGRLSSQFTDGATCVASSAHEEVAAEGLTRQLGNLHGNAKRYRSTISGRPHPPDANQSHQKR